MLTADLGVKKRFGSWKETIFRGRKSSNDILRVVKKRGSYFFTISTVPKGKRRKIVARMEVEEFTPKLYKLFKIYVDPDFRNQGYGKTLMNELLDFLDGRNATATLVVKPFEESGEQLLTKEFLERRKGLIEWYSNFGFKLLKPYTKKQLNHADMSINMIRGSEKQL